MENDKMICDSTENKAVHYDSLIFDTESVIK
jgi:hypothetical protein